MDLLICAFACHPDGTSGLGAGEDVLGWNIVRQAARFHRVCALTHAGNRAALEQARKEHGLADRLQFEYVRLPGLLECLVKNHKGPIQLYSYLWQWTAYRAARRLHRAHDFSLFHHVTFANDWLASPTGALLPIPYIRGPGGGAHRMPPALLRSRRLAARFWERIRSVGQWLCKLDPLYRRGQSRAYALLFCNHDAARAVPQAWRDKTRLFPVNGIAPEDAVALATPVLRPPADEKRFIVVSAGHFISLKCFDLGIRAFAILAGERPNAIMELIGDGPEWARLVRLVDKLGMTDQIRFPGWMTRPELLQRIAQADVFLFPSARDGGAAVIVEAMVAATPVVCLDTGGPGYHVREEWGIKVAPARADRVVRGIADALQTLHDNPDLRARLGAASRQRARDAYLWDRLGEQLNQIYSESLTNTDP